MFPEISYTGCGPLNQPTRYELEKVFCEQLGRSTEPEPQYVDVTPSSLNYSYQSFADTH